MRILHDVPVESGPRTRSSAFQGRLGDQRAMIVEPEDKADDGYREHILGEIRSIARMYLWLNALANGASRAALVKLEASLGGEPKHTMSDAAAWRLTIEVIMRNVDHAIGVRGASKAAFARHGAGMRWRDISEGIRQPQSSTKAAVTSACARLYMEFVTRGITDDYRERAAA